MFKLNMVELGRISVGMLIALFAVVAPSLLAMILLLNLIGFLCLERWKVQPSYVIAGALFYGYFLI